MRPRGYREGSYLTLLVSTPERSLFIHVTAKGEVMTDSNNDQGLRIGFIGLGDMGGPIARHIQAGGYEFRAFDLRPSFVAPYLAAGSKPVSSCAELAAAADIVMICVGMETDVEASYPEVIENMAPGSVLVIHSTVHPDLVSRIADEAKAYDVDVLDAPVSGGHVGSVAGTLTVMVGGDPDVYAKVEPIFAHYSQPSIHVGPAGKGQIVKLLNNYLHAAQIEIANEAAQVVAGLGMDQQTAFQVIATALGSSAVMEMLCKAWTTHEDGSVNVFTGMQHTGGPSFAAEQLLEVVGLARQIMVRHHALNADLDAIVERGIQLSLAEGAAHAARS
jgi:3-hydroxyisobutyrate dehydrogenase